MYQLLALREENRGHKQERSDYPTYWKSARTVYLQVYGSVSKTTKVYFDILCTLTLQESHTQICVAKTLLGAGQ